VKASHSHCHRKAMAQGASPKNIASH